MSHRVVIDQSECIGCESCVEICPEVFGFDEEQEKAYVILEQGGPEDKIQEAITTCPTECISFEN
jgi:ferredoxin